MQDPDELLEAAHHLLRNSYFQDAEEWAIFDYEGIGSLKLSEYESRRASHRQTPSGKPGASIYRPGP